MSAVAQDLLGSNSTAAICLCFHSFVVTLSFKSSLNRDEAVARNLQQSKLVRLSSSLSRLMVLIVDALLSAEASQSLGHEQLISYKTQNVIDVYPPKVTYCSFNML